MGGAIPGLVVLGSLRKQAEQAMRSKPVSSTPPWHGLRISSCLQVSALLELAVIWKCNLPCCSLRFFLHLAAVVGGASPGLVVLASIRKQAEQARRSKPITSTHSFMTSASAPASRFLPCSSSCSDFL